MECLTCLHCDSIALKKDVDGCFCFGSVLCDLKGFVQYIVDNCCEYEVK